MPVKIRLSRKGKKKQPIYHIVVADSRAPRDGRFIEVIGKYIPTTKVTTIELDTEKALAWLQKGAQPTETCRSILSVKGVMLKKHLLEGVKKGAFSDEEAERRFTAWMEKKEASIKEALDMEIKAKKDARKKRIAAEEKINAVRAEAIKAKNAELAAEAAKAAAAEKASAEPPAVEQTAETGEEDQA